MITPLVTRPHFPKGYVDNPSGLLTWEQVEARLAETRQYWLCSVRPNDRPHAIPVWGIWVNSHIYFDGSPETRHARNIALNPFVNLHLESGEKVVIMEGSAREIRPGKELAIRIAQSYSAKYASLGYSPEPASWDGGGLFEIEPHVVIAWTSFMDDPTKFIFPVGTA